MLRLSKLFIYPIKSLGGISLDKALVTDRGLQYDRRWMLVNPDNIFMTQREWPAMALIRIDIGEEGLEVRSVLHPDPLFVPFKAGGDLVEVRVWDDTCRGQFVNQEA